MLRESATCASHGRSVILWVDAQLSPALARWIRETFQIEAQAVLLRGVSCRYNDLALLPIGGISQTGSDIFFGKIGKIVEDFLL